MKSKWAQIEKWFKKHNKEVLKTFNPPAKKKDVDQLETLAGKPFPGSFKEFYAIHDGQDTGMVFNSAIIEPESEGLYPLSRIVQELEMMNGLNREYATEVEVTDVQKGIKPVFWNSAWVPVMGDGMGNYYCIDLDPAKGGKSGQIIFRDHEGPAYRKVASSFESWVDTFIEENL